MSSFFIKANGSGKDHRPVSVVVSVLLALVMAASVFVCMFVFSGCSGGDDVSLEYDEPDQEFSVTVDNDVDNVCEGSLLSLSVEPFKAESLDYGDENLGGYWIWVEFPDDGYTEEYLSDCCYWEFTADNTDPDDVGNWFYDSKNALGYDCEFYPQDYDCFTFYFFESLPSDYENLSPDDGFGEYFCAVQNVSPVGWSCEGTILCFYVCCTHRFDVSCHLIFHYGNESVTCDLDCYLRVEDMDLCLYLGDLSPSFVISGGDLVFDETRSPVFIPNVDDSGEAYYSNNNRVGYYTGYGDFYGFMGDDGRFYNCLYFDLLDLDWTALDNPDYNIYSILSDVPKTLSSGYSDDFHIDFSFLSFYTHTCTSSFDLGGIVNMDNPNLSDCLIGSIYFAGQLGGTTATGSVGSWAFDYTDDHAERYYSYSDIDSLCRTHDLLASDCNASDLFYDLLRCTFNNFGIVVFPIFNSYLSGSALRWEGTRYLGEGYETTNFFERFGWSTTSVEDYFYNDNSEALPTYSLNLEFPVFEDFYEYFYDVYNFSWDVNDMGDEDVMNSHGYPAYVVSTIDLSSVLFDADLDSTCFFTDSVPYGNGTWVRYNSERGCWQWFNYGYICVSDFDLTDPRGFYQDEVLAETGYSGVTGMSIEDCWYDFPFDSGSIIYSVYFDLDYIDYFNPYRDGVINVCGDSISLGSLYETLNSLYECFDGADQVFDVAGFWSYFKDDYLFDTYVYTIAYSGFYIEWCLDVNFDFLDW